MIPGVDADELEIPDADSNHDRVPLTSDGERREEDSNGFNSSTDTIPVLPLSSITNLKLLLYTFLVFTNPHLPKIVSHHDLTTATNIRP